MVDKICCRSDTNSCNSDAVRSLICFTSLDDERLLVNEVLYEVLIPIVYPSSSCPSQFLLYQQHLRLT